MCMLCMCGHLCTPFSQLKCSETASTNLQSRSDACFASDVHREWITMVSNSNRNLFPASFIRHQVFFGGGVWVSPMAGRLFKFDFSCTKLWVNKSFFGGGCLGVQDPLPLRFNEA